MMADHEHFDSEHHPEKCPECALQNVSAVLQPDTGALRPVRTFTDDDGITHVHEKEPMTVSYRCKNGHHLTRFEVIRCPGCGWRHGELP